jgi:hypothetical protein
MGSWQGADRRRLATLNPFQSLKKWLGRVEPLDVTYITLTAPERMQV